MVTDITAKINGKNGCVCECVHLFTKKQKNKKRENSYLVTLALLHHFFRDALCDLRTENEKDDLQWPHSSFPLSTLGKTVDQVKQLLCRIYVRKRTLASIKWEGKKTPYTYMCKARDPCHTYTEIFTNKYAI